jgi:hypothetical protein
VTPFPFIRVGVFCVKRPLRAQATDCYDCEDNARKTDFLYLTLHMFLRLISAINVYFFLNKKVYGC